MPSKIHLFPTLSALLFVSNAFAQASLPAAMDGSLGIADYFVQGVVRGEKTGARVLPYAYFDYQRFFARVDTFGVKTLPVGNGYLELTGRVSFEGYKADATRVRNIQGRSNPVPIGVGSYQEVPFGAFFLYAFHDFTSGGSLLETTFATQLQIGTVKIYPQFGLERRSASYVSHLYGVSPAETASSGLPAYRPRPSVSPVLSLALEIPVVDHWNLNLQYQHRWLGSTISDSPLVESRAQGTGFVALAYQF